MKLEGDKRIASIRFADDQCVLATSEKGLQVMMKWLNKIVVKYGMKMNEKKSVVMHMGDKKERNIKVTLNGKQLQQVKEFRYLGSVITRNAKCHEDIKKRIAIAKAAFNKRREIFTKSIGINTRKRIMKCLVWSVATYYAETWTLRQKDIKRLEAFEMWCWRRMAKVTYMDKKSNEEVLKMVGEHRKLLELIQIRRHKWIGHVLRHYQKMKMLFEIPIQGRLLRGRKRKKFFDMVAKYIQVEGYSEVKRAAENRLEWRKFIRG